MAQISIDIKTIEDIPIWVPKGIKQQLLGEDVEFNKYHKDAANAAYFGDPKKYRIEAYAKAFGPVTGEDKQKWLYGIRVRNASNFDTDTGKFDALDIDPDTGQPEEEQDAITWDLHVGGNDWHDFYGAVNGSKSPEVYKSPQDWTDEQTAATEATATAKAKATADHKEQTMEDLCGFNPSAGWLGAGVWNPSLKGTMSAAAGAQSVNGDPTSVFEPGKATTKNAMVALFQSTLISKGKIQLEKGLNEEGEYQSAKNWKDITEAKAGLATGKPTPLPYPTGRGPDDPPVKDKDGNVLETHFTYGEFSGEFTTLEYGLWQDRHKSEIMAEGQWASEEDEGWKKEKGGLGLASWKIMSYWAGIDSCEDWQKAKDEAAEDAASKAASEKELADYIEAKENQPKAVNSKGDKTLATHYIRPLSISDGSEDVDTPWKIKGYWDESQKKEPPWTFLSVGKVSGFLDKTRKPWFAPAQVQVIGDLEYDGQQYKKIQFIEPMEVRLAPAGSNPVKETYTNKSVVSLLDEDYDDFFEPEQLTEMSMDGDVPNSIYILATALEPMVGISADMPMAELQELNKRKANHHAYPYPEHWNDLIPYGYNCYYDPESHEYKIKLLAPAFRRNIGVSSVLPDGFPQDDGTFATKEEYDENANFEKIKEAGLTGLLKFYAKKFDKKLVKKIMKLTPPKVYIPPETDGIALDKQLKVVNVLVCVDAATFQALPDRFYTPKEIGAMAMHTRHTVTFPMSELKPTVDKWVKEIKKRAGILKHLFFDQSQDMLEAAKELELFPSKLKEFMIVNGYKQITDQVEHSVEIGFRSNFAIQHISISRSTKKGEEQYSNPLLVAIDNFSYNIPLEPTPDPELIIKEEESKTKPKPPPPPPPPPPEKPYSEMTDAEKLEADKKAMGAAKADESAEAIAEFEKKTGTVHYTNDPVWQAAQQETGESSDGTSPIPGLPPEPYVRVPTPIFAKHQSVGHYLKVMFSDAELENDKKRTALMDTQWALKYHYPIPRLKPSDQNKKPPFEIEWGPEGEFGDGKDPTAKAKEDEELNDIEHKKAMFEERGNALDFTGDNLLQDIIFLSQNIKTTDDVYEHVLNKSNGQQLAQMALAAMLCTLDYNFKITLLLEGLLKNIPIECIMQIVAELKAIYPNVWKDAQAAVEKELDDTFENSHVNKSQQTAEEKKEKKAAIPDKRMLEQPTTAALAGRTKTTDGVKREGSADQNRGELSPEQQQQLIDNVKSAAATAAAMSEPPKKPAVTTPDPKLSTKEQAEKDRLALLKIANDTKGAYQIGRPVFQRLVMSCVENEELQAMIKMYFAKADALMAMIPPMPPVPPPLPLPPTYATADPTPGIGEMIVQALKTMIAAALIGTVIMILQEVKRAMDEACEDDPGELSGEVDEQAIADAMAEAGIGIDDGSEYMKCVLEHLTAGQLEDLTNGNISDQVKAVLLFCAGKKDWDTPDPPITLIPGAFRALGNKLPANFFSNFRDSKIDNSIPDGIPCIDDDEFPFGIPTDPLKQAENDRKAKRIKRLRDIMENASNLLPTEVPAMLADGCAPGLVDPKDLPSMNKANEMVIGALFAAPQMAFSDDISGFADSLIVKELGPAGPTDPDYIPMEKGDNQFKDPIFDKTWKQGEAQLKNMMNQKVRPRVAPRLRENLVDRNAIRVNNKDGYAWVTIKGDIIKSITPSVWSGDLGPLIEAHQTAKTRVDDLETLAKSLDSGGEGLSAVAPQLAAKTKQAKKDLKDTHAALEKAATKKAKKESETPKILTEKKITFEYIMPWRTELASKTDLYDKFFIKTTAETPPVPDLPPAKVSSDLIARKIKVPKEISIENYSMDNWHNGGSDQQQAFANLILDKYLNKMEGYGEKKDEFSDWHKILTNSGAYNSLKMVHTKIFRDMLTRAAWQIGKSPMFETDCFKTIIFAGSKPDTSGGESPGPNNIDLFGVDQIKEDISDELAKSCKKTSPRTENAPVPIEKQEKHAFKDAARHGVVKAFIRVHLIEPLMRSVFLFSEYSLKEVGTDDLFINYVLDSINIAFRKMDNRLVGDLWRVSRTMIEEALDKPESKAKIIEFLKTPRGKSIDKSILYGTEGNEREQAEEAIKYYAATMIDDIVDKFEEAVGARTPSIHKRFLNPPQNSMENTETTEVGMPIELPTKPDAGWIRTIDVPIAARTALQHNRFLSRFEQPSNFFPGTAQKIALTYPDLAGLPGTFFLERYIRIEDKFFHKLFLDQAPQIKEVQERTGGPLGFDEEQTTTVANVAPKGKGLGGFALGITKPHLSGVVNLKAWEAYVKDLDIDDAKKVQHLFKPWKYGLRLVYVPRMNPEAQGQVEARVRAWNSTQDHTPKFTTVSNASMPSGGGEMAAKNANKYFDEAVSSVLDGDSHEGYPVEEALASMIAGGIKKAPMWKVAKKEKAFRLEEKIDLFQTMHSSDIVTKAKGGGGKFYTPQVTVTSGAEVYSKHTRDVFVIPLCSVEEEIDGLEFITKYNLKDYPYDSAALREKLIKTEEYQFLFKYIFPLPRMLALLTIYNANAVALSIPNTITAFDNTKDVLKNLFYSLGPSEEVWWQKEGTGDKEYGGNEGLKQDNDDKASNSGPAAKLFSLALKTIPLFVRGMADYVDPHYKTVSALTNMGYFPPGKTWKSVPILWPANFPFGWGPPLTPWGMMAYSMPEPDGDRNAALKARALADPPQDPCGDK